MAWQMVRLGKGQKKTPRRRAKKASHSRSRVLLTQALERRDFPGNMLPFALLSILDLGHELPEGAADILVNKDQESQRPGKRATPENQKSPAPAATDTPVESDDRPVRWQPRTTTAESSKESETPQNSPDSSRILQSISTEFAAAFLDDEEAPPPKRRGSGGFDRQPNFDNGPGSTSGGGGDWSPSTDLVNFDAERGASSEGKSASQDNDGGGGGGGGGASPGESGPNSPTTPATAGSATDGTQTVPTSQSDSSSVAAPVVAFELGAYRLNESQLYFAADIPQSIVGKAAQVRFLDSAGTVLGASAIDANKSRLSVVINGQYESVASLSAQLLDSTGRVLGKSGETTVTEGPDTDSDGIIDAIEKQAANQGDGDADGVADWQQSRVASLPESKNGQFVTLISHGQPLANVRPVSVVEETFNSRRLPFGLFAFDIRGVEAGGITNVDIVLPQGTQVSRYYKRDAAGSLAPFDFDGQTGAIVHGNRVSLYLQDGGRGDSDGIANGVILDPGAPEAGVITIGPGIVSPLDGWSWTQSGGASGSAGTVAGVAGDLVLTEGSSFLVEARRSVTIPDNPSVLEFEYFGSFDTTVTGLINDAFEVALIDSTGRSIVPTYLRSRDSYFNFTEEESPALGSLADHAPGTPVSGVSGVVQLDISDLLPGSTATIVLRLVNNDGDQGTTFGLKQTAASLIIEPLTGNEGASTSLSALLPGVTTTSGYSAVIDWGDGTTSTGSLSLSSGNLVVSGAHTYADDPAGSSATYPVSVTLSHSSTPFLTGATVATIANVAPSKSQPTNQTATAGASQSFTLGTFTDPGFTFEETSETFTTTVDWGDGSSAQNVTPSVTNGSSGTATSGTLPSTSHTYSVAGTYTVMVTVADDDGGTASKSFSVVVSAPAISISAISGNEGSSVTLGGTATGLNTAQTYVADITWGDGTTTTGVATTVSGSNVLISSSHTYADNKSGNYAVSVSLRQAATVVATGAATATITNVAPTKSQPANQTAIVGSSTSFVLGSFTDPGFTFGSTSETFSATVDWGDGSSVQNITPSVTSGEIGTATSGTLPNTSHTFSSAGTYTVTVTVTDDDGGTASKTFDVVVSTASISLSAVSGNEGSSVTLSGSAAGLNTSQSYTADISWGDGTTTTGVTATVSGSDIVITSNHTYADNKSGNYAINVTLKQSSTVVATGTAVATIANVAPTKSQPSNQTATAGTSQSFSLGTFTDPGFTFGSTTESFTVTVDWGDGSSVQTITPSVTNGSVGTSTSGTLANTSHTFATAGTYTVTVTVTDDDGGTASKTFDIVVSAPAISLSTVSGNEGSSVTLMGSASGLNTSLTYTADITWGDGTTSSGVATSVVGSNISISANHTYADDIAGDHTISVVLKQGSTTVATGSTTADIANVAPQLAFIQDIAINTELQPSGQERTVSFSSNFTDVGLLDTHTYNINWGDGSTASGSLTTTAGSGTVSGTRTYVTNGTYHVTVTVTDDDGGAVQRQFRVYISGDVITVTEDSFVELDLSGLEVDAGYNNELGMFIVEDVYGTIRDSNGDPLLPGDPGYALAAISHSSRRIILHRDYMAETKSMAGDSRQQHNYRVMVEAGSFVSFYAIQNQTTQWWLANNPTNSINPSNYKNLAFFTARDANPDDGHTHFRVTTLPDGSIRYGHEDLISGSYGVSGQNSDEDYNDLNFTIRVMPIGTSPAVKFFVDNNASSNDRIFFYNSEGTAIQTELAPGTGNTQSMGLTSNYDGSRLWSIDKNKSIYDYTYNSSTHALGTPAVWTPRTAANGALVEPTDIATDSQNIWVVDKNGASSRVYYYANAATTAPSGNVSATSSFALNSNNTNPSGLAVDATRVFVTDLTSKEVFVYQRSNGSYLGRWKLDPGNKTPTDITTEPTGAGTFGTNLYVVDKTSGEVFTYPNATGWTNNGNATATTFISKNSTWKYLVTGSAPAANWNSLGFNDSSWASGQATLGYGGGQTTTIGYGGNTNNKNNTTYFRKEFQVTGTDYTGLLLSLRRDDGAIIYLNGVEVARHNMPFGEIDYNTPASSNVNESSAIYHDIKISPTGLVTGTNVLAIEIHKYANSGSASSKLLMDAELKSYVAPFRIASTTFSLQLQKQLNGDTLSLNTFPEGIADPPPTATVTWTGGSSGSWHTASNWSTSSVPSSSDNVLIPSGSQVNITGTVSVNSIQGAGTVALTSGSSHLTLATESEIAGLTINGGVLEGAANITVTGTLTWTAGRIDGSGILYVASGATGTLSGSGEKVLDREMRNSGALTWSDGTWRLDDDSSDPYGGSGSGSGGLGDDTGIIRFLNEASGTLAISGSGSYRHWSSGAASSYDYYTGQYTTTHPPLIDNQGTITQTFSGTVYVAPSFDNDSDTNVQAGKLQLDGAGSSTGDFVVSSGATLQFDPSGQSGSSTTQYLSSAATISGSGTAVFAQGYTEVDGTVTVNKILVSSGEAEFDGSVGVQEIEITGGEGDFATNLSVPTLKMGGGVLEGPANVTVTSTLTWTAGRIDGSGILYVASGATGTLSGSGEKVLDREMQNSGALTWSDGTWRLDDDSSSDPYGGSGSGSGGLGDDTGIIRFLNEASGTLAISGSGSYRYWSSGAASSYDYYTGQYTTTHPPLIDNQGTITQTFNGTVYVAPSFDNDGDTNIQAGKLQLDGAGSSTGDFVVSSGATLQFDPSGQSGSSTTQYLSSAATISGAGTAVFAQGYTEVDGTVTVNKILVSSGEAEFDGSVGVQEIEITGGEGDFAVNLSVPTLKMGGGVLEGPANVTVTNTLTWTAGRIDGSGILYVASGATGTLLSSSEKVLDREMRNSGALTWSDGTWRLDDDSSSDPYGGSGSGSGGLGDDADIIRFVNEASGTLAISGSGSYRYWSSGAASSYDYYTGQYTTTHPPLIDNQGTITQTFTGTVYVAPSFDNDGDTSVQAGKLQLDGAGSSTGNFVVSSGATLQFDPSGQSGSSTTQYLSSAATISGAGTAVFAQGYTEVDGAVTVNKILVSSGEAEFDGSVSVQEIEITGGEGDFAVNLSVPTLKMGGGVLEGPANVTVTSTLTWTAGRIDGSGILYVASSATGTLSSPNEKVLDREMRNSGALTWNDGTWRLDDDSSSDPYGGSGSGSGGLGDDAGIIRFINEASGSLTMVSSPSGSGIGNRYLTSGAASAYDPYTYEYVTTHPPLIENLGTITYQTTLTTTVTPEIQNQGELTINSGKLVLQKPLETSGDVTIEYQSELQINGYTGSLSSDPYGGDPYGGGSGSGSGGGGLVDTRVSYKQTAGSTTINGGKLIAVGDAVIEAGELFAIGLIDTDLINKGEMTVAPGIGQLVVDGDFTQTSTGSLHMDATSHPTPQADSLEVKGLVNLAGEFHLDTSSLLSPPSMIALINNDGTDAIVGTFSNIDEGDMVTIAGIGQPYSYVGYSGNDFSFGYPLPAISITSVKQNEGQSGITNFVFTVALDGGFSYPVTVDYSTVDSSALAGEDYLSTSGTLTFSPGAPLTQTITVSVLGDLTPERRERFSLVLSNAVNGVIERGTGVGSILDDDGFAGALDNLGDEFWLTFPANYTIESGQQDLLLFITGPDDTQGTVEIPGLSFSQTFEVIANQITVITLPNGADLGDAIDAIENKGIHVTADDEVAVYGLNLVPYTSDAYLGLPVDILDDTYVVLGWKNSYSFAGTELAIVASEDDTFVTIIPTITVGSRTAGVAYTIELDEGETYQLRSYEIPGDVSGTVITATAPIAVFAGQQCANIPQGVTYCDYVVEQLTPTSTWGKSFVTVPLATRLNGDTFQIIAAEDDTIVKVDGTVVATLDRGEIFEDIFDTVTEIEATKPVFVAQYSNGQSYDGVDADPFMMTIPPTEQFLDDYTVGTPVNASQGGFTNTQFLYNFINVVVPTAAINSLRLNDAPIDSGIIFTPIGTSGFSGATIPVPAGSHHLQSDAPFGVYSYGFNAYDSYGYAGGLALGRIADVQTLALTPPEQTAFVNSMQSVSATIKDQNGAGIAGVRVDFVVSGANSATGSVFTNSLGVAEFFYTGTNVGDDVIVATFGTLTANAEKTWIAAAPTIEILSPAPHTDFTSGSRTLITGKATAADPSIPVVAVYMDGVPVDALDADGRFFVSTTVEAANQVYSFVAIDALGNQATTTLTLDTFVKQRGPIDLSTLSDVSTIGAEYGITSFDPRTNKLYAELAITNTGTYSINNPLLVGVKNISSASVFPSGYTGITPDGIPYFDFSAFIADGTLAPGESTLRGILQFHNPNRETFTYELVLLGQLNRAPEFVSSPPVETTAGTPYAYQVTAVDPDQDDVQYSLVAGPTGISFNPYTGALSWSPTSGDIGNHNITIQADDGRGARTLQSFLLSVEEAAGNRPPVFTSIPVITAYVGTLYQADVAVNDPDFDTVTLSLLTTTAGLSIASTGDRTGRLTWTPTAAQVGTHLVSIEADDSNPGGIAEQTFLIRVLPARGNLAPHILSEPIAAATAGVAYHYGVVAVDPDNDELTYSLTDAPEGMTINAETGAISWTPTSGTSGTTEVTVRVVDGQGWFDEQTYELQWINATPGTLSGTLFDDDDADGIRDGGEPALVGWTVYLDANQSGKLEAGEITAITNASGHYTFTGVPIGEYTVGIVKQPNWALNAPTSRVHSGTLSGGQTISGLDFALVTKTGGNNRPVFQSVPITTAVVGNIYQYRPAAFDADGDELTFSLAYGPRGMTIDPATGTLAWTPAEDENFYVDVTLRVDDGQGGFALQPFQVFLTVAQNSDPVFTSQPQGPAAVGVPWAYHASATDPDGDVVTYSLDADSLARGLTINSASGAIAWTPGAIGDFSVTVTAADDRGGSQAQTFTLPVRNNTPPRFDTVPPVPGFVGEVYTYNIEVSDGDGDDLTLTLDAASLTRGMTLNGDAVSGYTLQWTPSAEGDYPITLSLSDGESRVTQVFVLPVVAEVVETLPPVITSSPQGPIYAGGVSAWTYTIAAQDPDGDDNELTYTLDLPTSNGEVSLTGNVLSWQPSSPGSETFRIVVTDEDGQSTIQSFTATALTSRVGALPEITSVPTGPAVRGTTYQYQVVAFDPNGDTLTYALAEPVAGASIDAQTGLLKFTPGVASSVEFEIEVSDGIDGTRTQTFTLNVVSPPGTPPRFTSSPAGPAISGQAWNYSVAAIDNQGDAITYALVSATSSNGTETVSFNPTTRLLSWTPSAAALTITVAISATDVDGTTTQTFTLGSITAPSTGGSNEAPVFISQPQGPALVGQLWTYVARATDADGDTLAYSLDSTSLATGFTIDAASGRIQWQPTATGDFPVTVTVNDGNGGTTTQSFTLSVGRSNAAPTITSNPTGPAFVGAPWSYTIQASDPNDPVSSLTYELVSPAATGEVSFNASTGTLTWEPSSETSLTFTVKVTDPQGASATQTFTVPAVDPPGTSNAAPVFVSAPPTTIRSGELYRYVARAVDPDGDAVSYSLSSAPVGMTIHPTTGVVSWNPGSIGTYAVVIAASDGINAATTQSFSITVAAPVRPNQAPEITSQPTGPASRHLAWKYQVQATDPDGDALTYSLDTSAVPSGVIGNLAINTSTGLVTWTPTVAGSFVIQVTATDSSGASDTQQITLPVLENAPPQFTTLPPTSATALGTAFSYDAEASDPNPGDTITYALDQASLDRGLTINVASGLISWGAGLTTTAGSYPVTVTASDQQGAVATQSFQVRFADPAAPNAAPAIGAAATATLQIGVPFVRDLLATDADGDVLTFALTGAPTGLAVSTGGVLEWTPATPGVYTFTASANDGQATTTKEFTFTVGNQGSNAAPRITSAPNKTALANAIYRYDVNASDADGDTLVYSLASKPTGMQINYSTGLIQWIPTTAQLGDHEVTVSVSDSRGGVTTQTFVINVGNVNRPPVVNSNPPAQAVVGKPYAYPIRATDPDGHALTFSIDAGVTTADTNGAFHIDPVTGLVTWTPASSGTYRIQINVIDAFGLGTGQIFDVDVLTSLPNNPPRFTGANPPLEISAGETYSYDFAAIDPDDDTLTFSLPEGPSGATINASTGVLAWNTTGVSIGTLASFKVVVSDGQDEAIYRYSVRVQPANVVPYFSPEPADQTLVAGQTFRLDVKAYDSNAGDVIRYSLDATSLAKGMAIDNYGRISWVTDAGDITTTTPHSVTVTISDGRLSSTSTFNVEVEEDTTGPTIQIIASGDNLVVGEYVDLRVYALDDVAVTQRTLTLVSVTKGSVTTTLNQPLSLNAAGQTRLDILQTHMGTLLFEATAKDAAGNNAIPKQLTLTVVDPSDTNPPTVNLLPPIGDVIAPIDLLGTVHDDLPGGVSWSLTLEPADASMGDWSRQIASGNGLVTTATALAKFDPTMLAQGSYRLTLTATDAGGHTASDSEIIAIDGRLKLGNFSLSFDDLVVPVAGIPITIRRTYDTLDANKISDFGYGWSLDVVQPKITVDMSTTGPNSFGWGQSYPTFVEGTRVTVTTPDGSEESFTMRWVGSQTGSFLGLTPYYRPSFVPDAGNRYELIPPGAADIFSRYTENGPYTLAGDTIDYSALNPIFGDFQLKEIGPGTRKLNYTIDNETLSGAAVVDQYGNKLTFETDQEGRIYGISSNRGRSVTIERDWLGRITSITDPAGESLTYKYDSAGRLTSFYDRRATARLNDSDPLNDFQPTKFQYTLGSNPAFANIPGVENYLTRITDPLGTHVANVAYHDDGRLKSITGPKGQPTQFTVDTENLEETIVRPNGTAQSVKYDQRGNAIEEVDENGLTIKTDYDSENRPTQSVTILGLPDSPANGETNDRVTTTQYFNNGSYSVTDPLGNVTSFLASWNGQGLSVIDPLGNTTALHFDENGALLSARGDLGGGLGYSYDQFGNPSRLTRPGESNGGESPTIEFEYNSIGDFVGGTSVSGVARELSYDLNGQITGYSYEWVNPNDSNDTIMVEVITQRDADGNITRIETGNNVEETEYDALGREVAVTSDGLTTTMFYDALNNVVLTQHADGRTVRTIYDDLGRAVWESVPHMPGQVTYAIKTEYDEYDRVISTSRYANVIFDLISTGNQQYESVITSQLGVPEWTELTSYNDDGTVAQIVSRTGMITTYQYDHGGRNIGTTQIVGGNSYTWNFLLDDNDNRLSETDANGHTTYFEYDQAGRLVKTTYADGTFTTQTYNDRGALASQTDQLGNVTSFTYDTSGNLLSVTQPAVFDPHTSTLTPVVYEYEYDIYGHRTAITDAYGRSTTFAFNAEGQELSSMRPSIFSQPDVSRHTVYRNDGKIDYEVAFDGRVTHYTYDSLGQLAQLSYYWTLTDYSNANPAATTAFTYGTYTEEGRVDTVVDSRGVTTYLYDGLDRLITIASPEGTIHYDYDPLTDKPSSVWTAQTRIDYEYDARSLLTEVISVKEFGTTLGTPDSTTYTYTAVGLPESTTYANGYSTHWYYDDLNRPLFEVHLDDTNTSIDSYYYVRDAEGKVITVFNDLEMAAVEAAILGEYTDELDRDDFQYDALDRIISEAHYHEEEVEPYYQAEYVWDMVGNLHEKTVHTNNDVEHYAFTYNERDELVDEVFSLNSVEQWTGEFDYDLQGNLTHSERGDTTIEYEYNVRNQLESATNTTDSIITTAEYQYDHDGMQVRRTETTASTSVTEFLVRDPLSPYGYSRVLEKRTPGGVLLASFVHGREPIAEITAGSKHYLLSDVHSGVRTIVDASTDALQSVAYNAFGNLITPYPTISTDHLYRSEPYDVVSGQYYLRARYYAPHSTAFSQQDPYIGDVENPISLNRYQYADRDPLQNIDPTGKFSVAIALGTIAIMGGNLAKAHHDVQQGDRIVGIHLANLIMQSTVLNFIFTVIEEPLLSPHMVKAWVYWQRQLQPVLYKNASKLNLTPRRLQIAIRVMAGVYSDAARAQELGIPMKLNGFPNFSKLLYKDPPIRRRDSIVFRRLTGSRSSDFTKANALMRSKFPGVYNRQPPHYTWHHHEVVGIHMLVARGVGGKKVGSIITTIGHELLRHGGGVMYWSLINNKKYS